MRVLLLADSCNPEWASLPSVGYAACRAIAQQVDTVLATHVRNRPGIESHPIPNARVVFIDNEYIARPLSKIAQLLRGGTRVSWTTGVAMLYPAYLAFEFEVWKRFRSEIRAGAFDIIHRVTPMSPTLPSPIAKWSPVPFVLGPINGALRWPKGYEAELRREREWLTYVRNAYKVLPYRKATYKKAAAILAGFKHTIDDLPKSAQPRVIDFPEVGIEPKRFYAEPRARNGKRLTFIFVGRLVPYKCPDIALRAFAASSELRRHRLVIVGDGPERERLMNIAIEQKLEETVEWAGWRTQDEVAELMRNADVFVFPSIRELGAGVVVEAMASGLVPIVVDYGAPGQLVGKAGHTIPLAPKEDMVLQFTEAMESMADNPDTREDLSREARERALALFSWDKKAEKTLEVYEWALGGKVKPNFYK